MAFYTYILANKRNGTLYTGSTDDLARRLYEHQTKSRPGFSARYRADKLVWFESFDTREAAKLRERQIKEWHRAWKLRLIEGENPDWFDLSEQLNDLLPL